MYLTVEVLHFYVDQEFFLRLGELCSKKGRTAALFDLQAEPCRTCLETHSRRDAIGAGLVDQVTHAGIGAAFLIQRKQGMFACEVVHVK